ncbi:fused DSP-PTPase phosphatase/NAD kinase-like protein [Candidatus Protochlamydia phocaeensis]|uniref:fused DSP-PTPase phosphatase/NAD kinase-like protein n=1 Tax=Candidatus Protochlamydia phocaeensis TaxID=1414722 RepID=UPI000839597A|nr:dual specificity protein phosphatase family protein [Candidatus Protochlamydia phocaeensis]
MLKKILFYSLFFAVTWASSYAASNEEKSLLILNMKNEAALPRNFRTTQDAFKIKSLALSREGLNSLNLSGSAQFSENALGAILNHLNYPSHFFIIDLRQEYHGFLNGTAVSWYGVRDWDNVGKPLEDILRNERFLLQDCLKRRTISLNLIVKKDKTGNKLPEVKQIPFRVFNIATEREIANRYQVHYIRIPVTDHVKPTDEAVDLFISFVRNLPKDYWLHMHCAAGVGRTTTFMAMFDMIKNAKTVGLDDILKRQWSIGGLNFQNLSEKTSWKLPYAILRLRFLEDFYEYCRLYSGNWDKTWSLYMLEKQGKNPDGRNCLTQEESADFLEEELVK